MKKRLFFLRHDGWVEAELTRELMLASHEELVGWASVMMKRCGYRNYMVTENPQHMMGGRAGAVPLHEACTG